MFTYGFAPNEEKFIEKMLPTKKSTLTSTDCFTDIIACKSYAIIINMSAVSDDDLDMLWDYYLEVGMTSESVVLVGNVNVPKQLKNKMQVYQNFEELQNNLKYAILSAYRNSKKNESFSSTLANAITILSQIRLHPGITTAQLAKRIEISQRSVQRYIETLRFVRFFHKLPIFFKVYQPSCNKLLCIFPCFCPYQPKQGKVFIIPLPPYPRALRKSVLPPCGVGVDIHGGTDIRVT